MKCRQNLHLLYVVQRIRTELAYSFPPAARMCDILLFPILEIVEPHLEVEQKCFNFF